MRLILLNSLLGDKALAIALNEYRNEHKESDMLFTEEDIADASQESDVLFTEQDIQDASNSDDTLFTEEDVRNASGVHVIQEANIHDSIDAEEWAKEFCKFNTAADLDTMHTWFANAMMAMSDHVHGLYKKKQNKSEQFEYHERY